MSIKKSIKKISIRLSSEKLKKIREAALADDLSINQFVVRSVMTAVDKINAPATQTK